MTLAAAQVRLSHATRTTAPTALALLEHGGDLLDEDTANRTLFWLMDAVGDSSSFVRRTTPAFLLVPRLLETLAAVIPASDPVAHPAIVDLLIGLPPQGNQVVATSWARIVTALPEQTWNEDIASRLATTAEEHHPVLRDQLITIIARYDDQVRGRLEQEAAEGSMSALAALGEVPQLPPAVVGAAVRRLGRQLDRIREDARNGSQSFGGADPAQALAVLNGWHPEDAIWEPLLQFLRDAAVGGATKRRALHALGSLSDRLPPDVADELKPIAKLLTDPNAQGLASPFEREDATGAARFLAARLDPLGDIATAKGLSDLLRGDKYRRAWAARIAAHVERSLRSGLLLALANDVDPDVRAAAAAGLAFVTRHGERDHLAEEGLRSAVLDPGTRVPATVAHELARANQQNEFTIEVLSELHHHPSAYVRSTAGAALSGQDADERAHAHRVDQRPARRTCIEEKRPSGPSN